MPVACIEGYNGGLRHGQLTALSFNELTAAIRHARDTGVSSLTLVSHSFELLSRDRRRINRVVARRFARLCRAVADMPGVRTATFAHDSPSAETAHDQSRPLPFALSRGGARMIEQAVANALYR